MEAIQDYLKPRRSGKIQQGYYNPKNPNKYIGDLSKIIYRSSWEFKFLRLCDESPNIVRYSSEPISIPYLSPIDKRVHKYYIDFYVEQKCSDGQVQRWFIEVKPAKHTKMPKKPKKESVKSLGNYVSAVKRFLVNREKFKAARNYAKQQNMMFGVISLNRNNKSFELVEWDEKRIVNGL